MRIRLALFLLFLTTPAMAVDWYFSDCAVGCSANTDITHADCDSALTGGDPAAMLCLDPGNDGTNEIVEFLMNNISTADDPDAAAGDTIYLCCGACDGSGTCDMLQEQTWEPVVIGPMTITAYPGETVWIDGGAVVSDTDISAPSGILDHVRTDVETLDGYTWSNYNIKKFERYIFFLEKAPDNWTMTGMEIQQVGWLQDLTEGTADVTVPNFGPDPDGCGPGALRNSYVFYFRTNDPYGVSDIGQVGTITITNNTIHHVCKFVFRCNSQANASLIEYGNNEIYNVGATTNDFNCQNVWFHDNHVWDNASGVSQEWGSQGNIIEDNLFECTGTWNVASGNPGCRAAIQFPDASGQGNHPGHMKDNIVRRNTIIGYGSSAGTSIDNYYAGIWMDEGCFNTGGEPPCVWSAPSIVENNIIIGIYPHIKGPANFGARNSILIISTDPTIVRHNTIVDGDLALVSDNDNHEFIGNLITNHTQASGAVYFYAGESPTLVNNNVHDIGGTAVNVIGDASYTCAQIGNVGTGNICSAPVFVSYTGAPETYDLHVQVTDPGIGLADCTAAPTEDIDQGSRPATCDIGADEFGSPSGAVPSLEGGSLSGATLAQLRAWSCDMKRKTGAGACF